MIVRISTQAVSSSINPIYLISRNKSITSISSISHTRPRSSYLQKSTFVSSPKALASTSGNKDTQLPSITLYQYQICPFCNITKALLGYADIEHEVVEVNPLTKSELKPWSEKYLKVPIAKINGDQINGSEEIMNYLLDQNYVINKLQNQWSIPNEEDEKTMSLATFQSSESAQKWNQFARENLAKLLYPNICRSLPESYKAFGYVQHVHSFSTMQKFSIRSIGSLAMYFAASKIKSKLNISDERAALHTALKQWEEEALNNGTKQFASGRDVPDLGDIAVFGTLYSVKGLPAHDEIIGYDDNGDHLVLKDWYARMAQLVLREK